MDYKKFLSLSLLAIITIFTLSAYAAPLKTSAALQYHITYDAPRAALNIALTFKGNKKGFSVIQFPSEAAGITKLYKNITNIQVSGAIIKKTIQPYLYLINYQPGTIVVITYQVKQSWNGPPTTREQF